MASIFNTTQPLQANFNIQSGPAYTQPPVNAPLPNHILKPGAQPGIPQRPAKPQGQSIKNLIGNLPSLFNINHGS